MTRSDNQEEISRAVEALGLSHQVFRQLSSEEAIEINRACLDRFTTASGYPSWWWEYLHQPRESCLYDDFHEEVRLIEHLVPDLDAAVYFIAEDDSVPFPVYVTTTRQVLAVLAECYCFEFYLAPLNLPWLLCSTHHNTLVGVGLIIPRFQSITNH